MGAYVSENLILAIIKYFRYTEVTLVFERKPPRGVIPDSHKKLLGIDEYVT